MPSALIIVENASVPADSRVWPECCSLRSAGWDVTVISPTGKRRDSAHFETVDGVAIHRFDAVESGGGASGYIREYAVSLGHVGRLVRRLSKEKSFDVVQACSPPDLLLLTAIRLRRRGTATIFDHHDLSPELYFAKYGRHFPFGGPLRVAERIGFSLADVVLATNESFRDVAIRRGRKAPGDVFVVRNGPDTDTFKPVEADSSLKGEAEHLIGYVGLMGTQDGLDVAVDALAALGRRRTDWRAIFVGDGEVLPAARDRAQRLGIGDRVSFVGFVQDRKRLVQIIASCDVCISPEPRNSLNEKSTLIKVAEYMAVGRPVVAFDLPETRWTAQEAAEYAKRDDAEAFSDAIEALLSDPERRVEMGARGRARAEAELGWDRSEEALLAAYDRARERALPRARRRSPRTDPMGSA